MSQWKALETHFAMSLVNQTPDISGERQSGQDVRTQNVVACQAVANIVKTSLGPVGLDKMLVDDIGDVSIPLLRFWLNLLNFRIEKLELL